MQQRALNTHRHFPVLFGLLSLLVLSSTGCEEYYYTTPHKQCWASGFTCTIFDATTTTVNGYVTMDFEDGTVRETSDWGTINYNGYQSGIYFDWENAFNDLECYIYIDAWGKAESANYDHGYMEENITCRWIGSNEGHKFDYVRFRQHYFTSDPDITAEITNIVYDNGNLVSYHYQERLEYYPYSVIVEEDYVVEYDLSKAYNTKEFPNNIFFTFSYRPILSDDYSAGERFDPQAVSRNLVTRKRNVTQNKVVFENNYIFNEKGQISEFYQNFVSGAPRPTALKWTYSYSCQE